MEIIAGGVIMLVGFVLGRAHRPSKKPKEHKAPKEICQCQHVSSMHDQDGCHVIFYEYQKKIIGRDRYDNAIVEKIRIDNSAAKCFCRKYVGPNSVWIPELEGGS